VRLLGRFGIVLLLLGLGLGWAARRRWGPLSGPWPWTLALAVAPVHAAIVLARGAHVGVDAWRLLGYGGATVLLVAAAALVAARSMRSRSPWSSTVPLGQALLQAVATSALGADFARVGAAPPGLGSALVFGIAVVAAGAWLVWVPPRRSGGRRFGWLRRSGRLRT